jgi:hypothetical protein
MGPFSSGVGLTDGVTAATVSSLVEGELDRVAGGFSDCAEALARAERRMAPEEV